jgi:hypothetical protein
MLKQLGLEPEMDLLQENRSMATKPFRLTKVSISSLDVLGDEIVP